MSELSYTPAELTSQEKFRYQYIFQESIGLKQKELKPHHYVAIMVRCDIPMYRDMGELRSMYPVKVCRKNNTWQASRMEVGDPEWRVVGLDTWTGEKMVQIPSKGSCTSYWLRHVALKIMKEMQKKHTELEWGIKRTKNPM